MESFQEQSQVYLSVAKEKASEAYEHLHEYSQVAAKYAGEYSAVAMDHASVYTEKAAEYCAQGHEVTMEYLEKVKQSEQYQILEEYFGAYLNRARVEVNNACSDLEPWQIIFFTVAGVYLLLLLNFLWQREESIFRTVSRKIYKFIKQLPIIRGIIRGELDKTLKQMSESMFKPIKGEKFNVALPENGYGRKELMEELRFLRDMGKVDWKKGRISGTVYHGGEEWTDMLVEAYKMFAWSNPLHPDVFPGCRKMEAEVVQMCVSMFNGGPDACGTMTSGGTESILMACKSYREWALEVKGVTEPEMVVPKSIHAAFDKAAEYFKIKIIHVDVDPITGAADVRAMAKKVNKNTILIAGSCPGFPHGIIDPITELAALARKYNVGLHVDCCLGGFLVPFMQKAGFELPLFDFRIPEVTSISVDTHKYGYAPKGGSCILYSNKELRHHQFFVAPNWPGGIYACPSVAGSRAGAIIASTWAAMMSIGESGYIKHTKDIVNTARKIEAGMRKINGISVVGNPQVSVVAFKSDKFDIYRLGNELSERGWNLNMLQFPSCIHICVTLVHTRGEVAEEFLRDVQECTKKLLADPSAKTEGMGAIYGMAQSIPDRSFVNQIACGYIDAVYEAKKPSQ
eukprot:Nk52_evm99s224 gene=Nk52_evmTU99s224